MSQHKQETLDKRVRERAASVEDVLKPKKKAKAKAKAQLAEGQEPGQEKEKELKPAMLDRLEKQATKAKVFLKDADELLGELNGDEATQLKQLIPKFMLTKMSLARASVAQCVSAVELALEAKKGDGQQLVKEIVASITDAQAAFDSLSNLVSEAKEHPESLVKATVGA